MCTSPMDSRIGTELAHRMVMMNPEEVSFELVDQ